MGSEIAGFIFITYYSVMMVYEKIELYRNYQLLCKKEDSLKIIYLMLHMI